MGTTHTALSRAATAALATLAMVHLVAALSHDVVPAYARVILLGTGCATAAAAVLLRHDTFGSRLLVWVVTVLSAAGAVLVGTVGLPGSVSTGLSGTEVLVVALAFATGAFVLLDMRLRQASVGDRPPYAL
ncbi:hypothetical protein [Nocardioides xinjiangensis]|uniref:hypothetical protein n=1 Tax=Nocardioides xinjiangensis TaxID=2817376 RepID=UPI001B301E53|nr:hypothetical protein [Nocardioides sp. SYSU D00514]